VPLGGYCTVCQRWVWVQPHGECQFGHPASAVREIQQLAPERYDSRRAAAHRRELEKAPPAVLTRRGQYRWWWRYSLWILWTFTAGFANWFAFIWTGVRARKPLWIVSGLVYLLPLLFTLASIGTPWLRVAIPVQLFASAVSIVHALAIRPQYRAIMFGDAPRPQLEAPPRPPALPSAARPELPRGMDEDTAAIIHQAQDRIDTMADRAREIGAPEVREKTARLNETAEKILAELIAAPVQIDMARAFLSYYLEAAERIVCGYADLAGRGVQGADVEATLSRAITSLDSIQQAFDKELAAVLQRDIIDLDSEIELLERTVQMDTTFNTRRRSELAAADGSDETVFETRPPAAGGGGTT
jgi:hypothetical protein